MTDKNPIQFGLSIDPAANKLDEAFARAAFADEHGFNLVSIMDHPYNRRLLETWTLLTAIGARTKNVHLVTNVANLPLRPPQLLAKQAVTLDVITNGRMELGLGAGSYWDAIEAFGTPRRAPGVAYGSFREALDIIRHMFDHPGKTLHYNGDHYQAAGLRPGPAPAHRIPIWVGAGGPRMLRLVGRKADGLITSNLYIGEARLRQMNEIMDESAEKAGRKTTDVRRAYNLMGMLDFGQTELPEKISGWSGKPREWVEKIIFHYNELKMDTFIFWPSGANAMAQIEVYAAEVIPAVQAELAA